ncbi:glycosyltransferase [Nocardia sp. 348MFTsu5.1]|uniref:glycosyltransferase n=1 Tax=Nocardia sp. 348MFTsu5.1 TaxID=1172185 RepID=UPI00036F34BD|nr:glycosyltransferase [Nocardia sp. 348MFTsu5.1]
MNDGVIYLAGVAWDEIPGTDRKLASALAPELEVLWVDPPVSAVRYARGLRAGKSWDLGVTGVAPGIARLQVLVPPGTTRLFARDVISRYLSWKITTTVSAMSETFRATAIINASPEAVFPAGVKARRLFYITDDWVAGASLMGMSADRVRERMRRNADDADVTAAVSAGLAEKFGRVDLDVAVLPNGCTPFELTESTAASPQPGDLPSGPLAGLVGQVNERIDVSLVRAVADAGTTVVVIGPRTERAPDATIALDSLFAHPQVHWLGSKVPDVLPDYLSAFAVGMTPYVDNEFNRLSFPLKTLEYLGAGLPVVSSDLPSVRWLATEHVRTASTPQGFAELVGESCRNTSATAAHERIAFARQHSWGARGSQVRGLLGVDLVDNATTEHGG